MREAMLGKRGTTNLGEKVGFPQLQQLLDIVRVNISILRDDHGELIHTSCQGKRDKTRLSVRKKNQSIGMAKGRALPAQP
jgi:hypothetical protein